MPIKDATDIRQRNVRDILTLIRFNDILTKKQISKNLDLSFATVSNICNDLTKKGITEEVPHILLDKGKHTIGRNPMVIKLKYKMFYVLCYDLLIKNTFKLALFNLRNEKIFQIVFPIENFHSIEDFIEFSYNNYLLKINEYGINLVNVIGIGVAISGIFDTKTERVVISEIKLLKDSPLKKIINDIYGKSVFIDNESNLCVASTQLKELDRCKDILYIYDSEGLGVGIISNGRIIRGSRGYGAEICNVPIGNRNNNYQLFNNYGCVETDLSIKGFIAKFKNVDIFNELDFQKDWNNYTECIKKNDELALSVLKENGIIFGNLISILINLFDPQKVYIGGMVSDIFNEIIPYINEIVNNRLLVKRDIDILCDDNSEESINNGTCENIFNKWSPL